MPCLRGGLARTSARADRAVKISMDCNLYAIVSFMGLWDPLYDDSVLRTEEVAAILGIPIWTVRRLARQALLPAKQNTPSVACGSLMPARCALYRRSGAMSGKALPQRLALTASGYCIGSHRMASYRVLCTLANASSSINSVAFTATCRGMLSEIIPARAGEGIRLDPRLRAPHAGRP